MAQKKLIKGLEIIAVALLVIGVMPYMIQKGNCYWLWLAGNGIGLFTHYKTGGFWFIVRDIVFLALAVWGLIR